MSAWTTVHSVMKPASVKGRTIYGAKVHQLQPHPLLQWPRPRMHRLRPARQPGRSAASTARHRPIAACVCRCPASGTGPSVWPAGGDLQQPATRGDTVASSASHVRRSRRPSALSHSLKTKAAHPPAGNTSTGLRQTQRPRTSLPRPAIGEGNGKQLRSPCPSGCWCRTLPCSTTSARTTGFGRFPCHIRPHRSARN